MLKLIQHATMLKFLRVLSGTLLIIVLVVVTLTAYVSGFLQGYSKGGNDAAQAIQKEINSKVSSITIPVASPAPVANTPAPAPIAPSWGGPALWDAVNKRRVELGVNPLSVRDELCTIASIRLNELLDLGKLDGHAGFSNMPTARPDLKWIFDKYNLSEFLVEGASTPQEAVSLWENTLGHKELLSGGQYVWGCIYAQNGFGVAIAAY